MPLIPKIAIIGAGPAGLTLARLLHVSHVKVDLTIYERDLSPTSRPEQGGTLDLHEDTGLAAIRKCDLMDQFRKYARYDGDEIILADKNGTVIVHKPASSGEGPDARPEIDRERLKEILLQSVPEQYVRWDCHLKEVTEKGTLRFTNRTEEDGPFDLIIGADGGWSKVRSRLTDVVPHHAGVCGYEMDLPTPATTCPDVNTLIGKGGFISLSDRRQLSAQRMGSGGLKVRSWFLSPENEARLALEKNGQQGIYESVLAKHATWAPELLALLHNADVHTLRLWDLYELPVGHKWTHKPGFTLIGDAASLSTPFSGEGVNKAMTDALQLAELIEMSQDPSNSIEGTAMTLDDAVRKYEELMFPRAHKLQTLTMWNKQNFLAEDSPLGILSSFVKTLTYDKPGILFRIAASRPVGWLLYGYVWLRTTYGAVVRRYWRRN